MYSRILVVFRRLSEFDDERTKQKVEAAQVTYVDLERIGQPGGRNFGFPVKTLWVGSKVRSALRDDMLPGIYDADFYLNDKNELKMSELVPVAAVDVKSLLELPVDAAAIEAAEPVRSGK